MRGSPSRRSATDHAGSCQIHAVASRSVDVLTDLLQRSRARGAAFSHSTARGAWGIRFPTGGKLAIHGILGGGAFAGTDAPGRSRHVLTGDVVLVRGPVQQFMAH